MNHCEDTTAITSPTALRNNTVQQLAQTQLDEQNMMTQIQLVLRTMATMTTMATKRKY